MDRVSLIVCCRKPGEAKNLTDSVDYYLKGVHQFIPVYNAPSIAIGYNRAAKGADGEILVFAHSDERLLFSQEVWDEAAELILNERVGFLGIAGSRRLTGQADWAEGWPKIGFGSGAVLHTKNGERWMTSFGKYGAVVVLDGVFLAVRRKLFEEMNGFDEGYPGWHFYDLDITFRAYLAGLTNVTFPLLVEHQTVGLETVQIDQWLMHRDLFLDKWKSYLPQQIGEDAQWVTFVSKDKQHETVPRGGG